MLPSGLGPEAVHLAERDDYYLSMCGLFITGTDTGVGKTHVAAMIVRELRAEGVSVAAFKPACSGAVCDAGGWVGVCDDPETASQGQSGSAQSLRPSHPALQMPRWDDLDRLRAALGTDVADDVLCPQRFLAPLAPPLAARLEGREVDVARIDRGLMTAAESAGGVVIEGAGGWLCPLTEDLTFADWVAAWGWPVLIVSRPGLGTINHTLLTIEAIRQRGLEIAGVVFNATSSTACDDSTATNAAEIAARGGVRILGEIEFGASELRQRGQPVRIRWASLMGPARSQSKS